jgi:periplasmic protein TonB
MDALAARAPRRRPWPIRLSVLLSLLVHVAVLVALLVTINRRDKEELLPPPAPVTMLFEHGRREGPTLPNPSLQATPATPPSVESKAPPAEAMPTPPAPPAEPPPPPPAPAPVEAPPPAPAPPKIVAPSPPPPPVTAEPAPLPPPPPAAPQVVEPTPPAPAKPAPRTPPVRQAVRPPATQKPSDFPAPMDFSFGKPFASSSAPARPQPSRRFPGTIDMSLGPAAKGTANPTPYSDDDDGPRGADYRNLLSAWVAAHAYYPEQARRDGDEGDAKVRVLAGPDGRVKEVELIGKSGSMWLDLALQALFRDQTIPRVPGGGNEQIEFNFIMHYVLIRPR